MSTRDRFRQTANLLRSEADAKAANLPADAQARVETIWAVTSMREAAHAIEQALRHLGRADERKAANGPQVPQDTESPSCGVQCGVAGNPDGRDA
jgi:hypothetical protein